MQSSRAANPGIQRQTNEIRTMKFNPTRFNKPEGEPQTEGQEQPDAKPPTEAPPTTQEDTSKE